MLVKEIEVAGAAWKWEGERKKWLEVEDRSQSGVRGRELRSLDDLYICV